MARLSCGHERARALFTVPFLKICAYHSARKLRSGVGKLDTQRKSAAIQIGASGGIGRREGLKIPSRKGSGFDSRLAHLFTPHRSSEELEQSFDQDQRHPGFVRHLSNRKPRPLYRNPAHPGRHSRQSKTTTTARAVQATVRIQFVATNRPITASSFSRSNFQWQGI